MKNTKAFEVVSPVGGLNVMVSPGEITNIQSPDLRNVEFWEKELQGRFGRRKLTTAGLSGKVVGLDQYYLFSGASYLTAHSPKDVYRYYSSDKSWKYLTPTYTTGTVAVTNNSADIVGTNTVWSTNVAVGDKFRLGGLNDANPIWYEVQTVTDDTHITLTAVYAEATASGQVYTIRKLYTGGNTDLTVKDIITDLYVFTNGIDNIQKWDGDTSHLASDLGGSPPKAKFLCGYKDQLILGYTIEAGTDCPQRLRWSAVGNPESYPSENFMDLVEGADWLSGLAILGNYLVVFKERSIYLLYYVGGYWQFKQEMVVGGIGNIAPFSLGNLGDEILFLGPDGVYAFNGRNADNITDDNIKDIIDNLNPTAKFYSYGLIVEEKHQYWLAVPYGESETNDKLLVYDYFLGSWSWHDIPAGVFGYYNLEGDLTIGELEGTIGDLQGRIGDRFLLANAPINLIGGYDGYIYKVGEGQVDDGVTYTRYWVSKWFNFDAPHRVKTVSRLQPFLHNERGGSIDISIGTDFKDSWDLTKTISLDDATAGEILKPNVDFKLTAKNFRVKFSATNYFRLQKFIWYFLEKGFR